MPVTLGPQRYIAASRASATALCGYALCSALCAIATPSVAAGASKSLAGVIAGDYISWSSRYSGPSSSFGALACGMPMAQLPRSGLKPTSSVSTVHDYAGQIGAYRVGATATVQRGVLDYWVTYAAPRKLLEAVKVHSMKQSAAPVFRYLTDRDVPSLIAGVIDISNRIFYHLEFAGGTPRSVGDAGFDLLGSAVGVSEVVYCVSDFAVETYTKVIPQPLRDNLKSAVQGLR